MNDLSASQRLTVVDRQRVQDLMREIDLGAAGILDPKTAPKVGAIAKVRWVVFGTYLCRDNSIGIEAMLIDVEGGRILRIAQVEGAMNKLFDLEQKLVGGILAKLDAPMTEDELRLAKLLKTQSLPAFEHYSRSLDLFDRGQWFDALGEARLARRADPAYLPAAIRLAQLFFEVGEPEHSVIEYWRFVKQDRNQELPEGVYLALGKILEQAFADRAGAIAVFQRLVQRDLRYDVPFRITDASQTAKVVDANGGYGYEVDSPFEEHKASIEALERLARWQLEAGDEAEAARLYGQLWHWLNAHGMPLAAGKAGVGFHEKVLEKYGPLYWRLVLENRDAAFYPPCSVHLLPPAQAEVDPDTRPTHGYHKWIEGGAGNVWLAPPDREIAEVSFSLEDDGSPHIKELDGKAAINFICPGYLSILGLMQPQVKPDGAWHTVKFDPGIRALQIHPFTKRWKMKFTLRPWTQAAKIPEVGTYQVNFQPQVVEVYVNGKQHNFFHDDKSVGFSSSGLVLYNEPTGRYEVEARWPDGRRRSTAFDIVKAKRGGVFLNADFKELSRQVLATEGSNPHFFTDSSGRIWLLWDQFCRNDSSSFNVESNLFCANSLDGMNWSRPRRLPVSSLDCDATPILQQDRSGVFWLVWVSSRDTKTPKSLWIASSPNGVEWSFPRKIFLPETDKQDLARWREDHLPRPGFAIDARGIFWLVWQGWLMRSEDARQWRVDSALRTSEGDSQADNYSYKSHHLYGSPKGLLLVADEYRKDRSQWASVVWRRCDAKPWERLGDITQRLQSHKHSGSVAVEEDGSILSVALCFGGLWRREFMADGAASEPLCVESHLTKPFHPSIASLPDRRFLLAFGSKDGLVVTLLQKEPLEKLK
jgi:TolB-like protein